MFFILVCHYQQKSELIIAVISVLVVMYRVFEMFFILVCHHQQKSELIIAVLYVLDVWSNI